MSTSGKKRVKGAAEMGRFPVEIGLANNEDLIEARKGRIKPEKVRRTTLSGVVDPGATRLVLPANVAQTLGVPQIERVRTRYADGRTAWRDVVDEVRVELLGRSRVFDAIVAPNRKTALIGAIVLEVLDFLVDCTNQKLVPRDPRHMIAELE